MQKLTSTQAKELAADSQASWANIKHAKRLELLEQLNQAMDEDRLPAVSEEVFHWRMAQIVSRQFKDRGRDPGAADEEDSTELRRADLAEISPISLPSIRQMLGGPSEQGHGTDKQS